MVSYSFSSTQKEPLYIQLYRYIREDILSEALFPHEKLPSKRNLAKHLGVSNITVENAYAQLLAEGYLYSLPKRGYYVASIFPTPKVTTHPSTVYHESVKLQTDAPTTKFPNSSSEAVIDLTTNHTAKDRFPYSVWTRLIREVLTTKQDELMLPSPANGTAALREAICDHLKAYRNMLVLPEQIVIGAGTEYLYSLLIMLLGRHCIYAIENPGYSKISKIYASQEVSYACIPLDASGVLVNHLEASGANIAHISPSHHYPSGIVTSISRRYELLAWACRSATRYIIEDEYDSEFRLSGRPLPTLQSIDPMEKVIYMNTFTKSLASTIRISYMVLPPHLWKLYQQNLSFYACTVSNFDQYTLASFIHGGYFEKHINRMRTYYKSVRDEFVLQIKNSPFSSTVTISEEEAGLHFLLKVTTTISDDILLHRASRHGLQLSCLSQYYLEGGTQAPAHVLIMNYSGLSISQIPTLIKRLGLILLE